MVDVNYRLLVKFALNIVVNLPDMKRALFPVNYTKIPMSVSLYLQKVCNIYNKILVINHHSFRIEAGEMFGFLGPKGAQK